MSWKLQKGMFNIWILQVFKMYLVMDTQKHPNFWVSKGAKIHCLLVKLQNLLGMWCPRFVCP